MKLHPPKPGDIARKLSCRMSPNMHLHGYFLSDRRLAHQWYIQSEQEMMDQALALQVPGRGQRAQHWSLAKRPTSMSAPRLPCCGAAASPAAAALLWCAAASLALQVQVHARTSNSVRASIPGVCTSGLIVCAPSGMLVTFALPCGDSQISLSDASNMTLIPTAKAAWPVHADADLPAVVHELRKLPLARESDDRRGATDAACTPAQTALTPVPSQ